MCRAAWGCGPGRGWSGRCGGRAAGGFEEVEPLALAVPAFGQVEGAAAPAVAGGPSGDGDQIAADGGGAGPGVAAAISAFSPRTSTDLPWIFVRPNLPHLRGVLSG